MKNPEIFSTITTQSMQEIIENLKTNINNGLSDSEVRERQKLYGLNQIPENLPSWPILLLRQCTSPLIYTLFFIAGALLFLEGPINAAIIIICMVINISFGFFQEFKAQQGLLQLKQYIIKTTTVMRNGTHAEIKSNQLVPGDILILTPGDLIPADVRFIKTDGVTIDESVLSGESSMVEKTAEPLQKKAETIFDAKNIGFAGTTLMSGKAQGIVIATGLASTIGSITEITTQAIASSNLQKGIAGFIKVLLFVILITIGILFFAYFFIKGGNLLTLLLFCAALAISIIPEPLPAIVSFSLTRGALRLAQQQVVVKRLSALEDLGGIQILCTDKTGTITQNSLSIKTIFGKLPEETLMLAATTSEKNNSSAKGFDSALWQGLSEEQKKQIQKIQKVHEFPFDPNFRKNAVIIKTDSGYELIVRGSAQDIVDSVNNLSGYSKEELQSFIDQESAQGHRVLGISKKTVNEQQIHTLTAQQVFTQTDGMFFGFISFEDPLKPDASKALQRAQDLNVRIVLLSGDVKEVCASIAHAIGLLPKEKSVISGTDLEKKTIEQKKEIIAQNSVFARLTPLQKTEIIQILQEENIQVAYVGDGINDAPALKIADVSFAVDDAVDIARNAADIILLQKSLHVIVNGIFEGRTVFANVLKYIRITLSANFGNFFALAIASLMLPFLPLLPTQILVLNLLSDFPMLGIATDTVSIKEIRQPLSYHIKNIMVLCILLGAVSTLFDFLFFVFFRYSPEVLQTNWFIGSVLTELALIFSVRSQRFFLYAHKPSTILVILALATAVCTIIMPYTSVGQKGLEFVRPKTSDLFLIFILVFLYFICTEIVKVVYYRFFKK